MSVDAVNSFVNPATALKRAAQLWFTSAAIGHWLFVYYVAALYVPLLLARGAPGLADTHLPHGYIPGDVPGNASMVAHLLLSIIIIGGGPLQLIPRIRGTFPAFHRWNGRVFMATAVLTSLTGIYMSWSRGEPPIGGLNGAEYRLLAVLLAHGNRVLSRVQLMELLRGRDIDPFDRSIDVRVSRLRQILRDEARTPRIIKTIYGEGYVIGVAVESE